MTDSRSDVDALHHGVNGLTGEIYLLVLLCSILIVIFLFRSFGVIATYILKQRREKSKQRQRQMEKTYKRRVKKNLKLEMAKLKKANQARAIGSNTDKSEKEKTTETTTTKSASESTSQRASSLHKPGTPLSKTIMCIRPGLKDDDIAEEVLHVQFENVSERPPRNSTAEYRFVETKWVEPPEEVKGVKDCNTNSVNSHASKVAGSNSFGTPISSFSNEGVSTLKASSHSSLDTARQAGTPPIPQQQPLPLITPKTAIGTGSNISFTMYTANQMTPDVSSSPTPKKYKD